MKKRVRRKPSKHAMLNDMQCRNAKLQAKPYKRTDGKGLYLEVKPNGVKAWRYRFKLSGKESVFAIGDYPAIPLVDARKKKEEARNLVKQGINPAHNRQLEKIKRGQEAATTFEAVALEWLALKDWEAATKARRLDMLQRVVFPAIGQCDQAGHAGAHPGYSPADREGPAHRGGRGAARHARRV